MIGQVKQFSISAGGVVLLVNVLDMGGGQIQFNIVSQDGSAPADINAIYWGDLADESGKNSQFNLGGSLNMNGTPIDFDGGVALSPAGLGFPSGISTDPQTTGTEKATYLTAGESYQYTLTGAADDFFDKLDNLGIRATSTGFDGEGSIKGYDGDDTLIDAPKASVSDITVCEGIDATATVKLTLSEDPDGPYPYPVTVYYTVADGSALEASDYDGSGVFSHTFQPGETSLDLVFPITDDAAEEPDEHFLINITNVTINVPGDVDLESATAYTADGEGRVTILDKDEDGGGGGGGGTDHFPDLDAAISNATFYFATADTALPGSPDGDVDNNVNKNDGVYTVKIDNWNDGGGNDLDDVYQQVLDYLTGSTGLVDNDVNIDATTPLLGVAIKAGNSEVFYALDGDPNDVDDVPPPLAPGDLSTDNEIDRTIQFATLNIDPPV